VATKACNNEQGLSVYGRETVQLLPTLPDKRRINDGNSDQTRLLVTRRNSKLT